MLRNKTKAVIGHGFRSGKTFLSRALQPTVHTAYNFLFMLYDLFLFCINLKINNTVTTEVTLNPVSALARYSNRLRFVHNHYSSEQAVAVQHLKTC